MIFSQSSVVGALALALGLFSQTAAAASTGTVGTQDVYVPPVLTPNADTVWFTGRTYNVTWDTSDPPAQITNRYGRILLRKGDFTTPIFLASGFDILEGHVEVTVPLVVSGDDYQVVLFGDSGNFSPYFTISISR
ncbi:hypothetical protein C8Q76DRAFT_440184 [Earliella scabrosa]|nr:hypothetical protein C8Q76DRAFT_440184 [Earliella scabrosa]